MGSVGGDPLISVVVTTYERPDALDLVLRGLSRQTDDRHEVVVADDGSGPATAAVIDAWRGRFAVPLRHAWEMRDGFRLARSRNRGIALSEGAYIVFLDGDCVPRADFVAAHRRVAEPGFMVGGARVMMSEALTRDVLARREPVETWSIGRWLNERRCSRVDRVYPLLSLPGQWWRTLRPSMYLKLKTANVAVWRADLDAVDGFDGAFVGWGFEDTDLAIRLTRHGVRFKDGRYATAVVHLWHPASDDRSNVRANRDRLNDTLASGRVRATAGLSGLAAV
jgi:glycosyltransferase involved in cell wall biosynthesis